MGYFWSGFHGMTWFGGIGMILFWILILAFVIWGVVMISRNNSRHGSSSKALDIAQERYAKGEISKEQYEEIKKSL